MKIVVIGAGMAGLLASAMLRSECDELMEAQTVLPNNHSAVLRFRSSIVGDTLGIEFKKVQVLKSVVPWRNTVADALAYSNKCTGEHTLRSSLSAKSEMETRYIAPNDFIQQMADRACTITFNKSLTKWTLANIADDVPAISTLPMPTLMDILDYKEKPAFRYVHGCNINATVEGLNAYCTLYVPDPSIAFNRVSITGNKVTIEFSNVTEEEIVPQAETMIKVALWMIGIEEAAMMYEVKDQKYSKILPIDDDARKRFIIWASNVHNVYSLGRYATWRPNILIDDVVNDVRVIRRLISSEHNYDQRKA